MTDYKGAGQPGDKAHKHRLDRFYLDAQATGWPTPKNITGGPEARESRKRRPRSGGEQSGSRNLPGSKANMGVSLTDAVKTGTSTTPRQKGAFEKNMYPTPAAVDYGTSQGGIKQVIPSGHTPSLSKWARSRRAPTSESSGQRSSSDTPASRQQSIRRLNPTFVEWLMGFPLGWVSLAPLESTSYERWATQSYLLLRRMLG
jgi:hypothetical protein